MRLLIIGLVSFASVSAFAHFDFSSCDYVPKVNMDDPEASVQYLGSPESYYLKSMKKYFLATDQCQKEVVRALGGVPKKLPRRKNYVNFYEGMGAGFPDGVLMANPLLGVVAYVSSDGRGKILTQLGFKMSQSEDKTKNFITDEGFANKLWNCRITLGNKAAVRIPCAAVPFNERF